MAAENICRMPELLPGAERDRLNSETMKQITSAADIVEQMELEACSAGPSRSQLLAQVREYRTSIAELRARHRQAANSNADRERARADLLSGSDKALRVEAEAQHSRLLATTERLQRGTDKLRNACQTALETEAIGTSIMSDLEAQRHTLEHARGTLATANIGLARSKKLLQGMGRRARANKALMMLIISILCLMICVIIWLNWFYVKEDQSPPPPPPPPTSPLR